MLKELTLALTVVSIAGSYALAQQQPPQRAEVSAAGAGTAEVGTEHPKASPPPLTLDPGVKGLFVPDFCLPKTGPTPPPADKSVLYFREANGKIVKDENGKELPPFTQQSVERFICEMLPVAIRMDRDVFNQRRYVEYLNEQSSVTNPDDLKWLGELRQEYGLPENATMSELLERVDVAPIPLLLAQGALESTWGQSRFAVQGFNFFGIHGDLAKDGPARCIESASKPPVCVRKYPDIGAGVSGYIAFLNTQASMDDFRKVRAAQRAAKGDYGVGGADVTLDSVALADTLEGYSQIGKAYAGRVISLMENTRPNRLTEFPFDENLMPPLSSASPGQD